VKVIRTDIPEVMVLEPKVFGDHRGFFFESYNELAFHDATGLRPRFVQDNHSRSTRGVLRGLHYQIRQAQGKLLRCTAGEIFDVAVDIRRSSSTFGRWVGARLSGENKRQLWVPAGFAHGFLVLSDSADLLYKTTDYYAPEFDRGIVWNDPDLKIQWPLDGEPLLSDKDRHGRFFRDADLYE